MPLDVSEKSAQTTAFELKAGTFTLPLLRLLSTDMDAVANQLAAKVEQVPDFFRNTPVVIDLGVLADQKDGVDFALLVGQLRGHGMIPIGVRGGNKAQNEAAFTLELAILSEGNIQQAVQAKPDPQPAVAKKPPVKLHAPQVSTQGSMLITQPIRSGQRVYAADGDLVILAPVSSGAEIIADGHIHVYGALRGRALAGVKGNQACRIFCKELQAELVSVAGHYRISENLDTDKRGKPVQVYLEDQSLIIDEL